MKIIHILSIITIIVLSCISMGGSAVAVSDEKLPVNGSIMVSIIGLERGDIATLSLSKRNESDTSKLIWQSEIIQGEEKLIVLDIKEYLDDGYYQLMLDTSCKYIRDPKGYYFQVQDSKIVNPAENEIMFEMNPPQYQAFIPLRNEIQHQSATYESENQAYLLERIISLSAPIKQGEPDDGKDLRNTGYHYVGPKTNDDSQGVWGRFYVVDPGIRHNGTREFFANRVYARRYISGIQHWIETGWSEVSWDEDARYLYEFDSVDRTWNLYSSLTTGSTLEVRIQCISGYWWAQYKSGGYWYTLAIKDLEFSEADQSYNRGEIYTDYGDHPSLPDLATNLSYLKMDDSWILWDGTIATSTNENPGPYGTFYNEYFYDFYIHD